MGCTLHVLWYGGNMELQVDLSLACLNKSGSGESQLSCCADRWFLCFLVCFMGQITTTRFSKGACNKMYTRLFSLSIVQLRCIGSSLVKYAEMIYLKISINGRITRLFIAIRSWLFIAMVSNYDLSYNQISRPCSLHKMNVVMICWSLSQVSVLTQTWSEDKVRTTGLHFYFGRASHVCWARARRKKCVLLA